MSSYHPAEVGALVGRLVDKSLVVADGSGRFRLLLTLAEYGPQRLDERDAGVVVRDRHAAYHARLAERRRSTGGGPAANAVWWLATLTAELDNLRAALEWSIARGDARDRPAAGREPGLVLGPDRPGRRRASLARAGPRLWRPDATSVRVPPSRGPRGSPFRPATRTPQLATPPRPSISPSKPATSRRSGWPGRCAPSWPCSTAPSSSPPVVSTAVNRPTTRSTTHGTTGSPPCCDHWRPTFEVDGKRREEGVTAIDILRSVGDLCTLVLMLHEYSRMLQSSGRIEAAEAAAREAHDVSESFGLRGWQSRISTRLGSLAVLRGDDRLGAEHYRAALRLAASSPCPTPSGRTRGPRARPPAQRRPHHGPAVPRRGTCDRHQLGRSATTVEPRADVTSAEHRRLDPGLGPGPPATPRSRAQLSNAVRPRAHRQPSGNDGAARSVDRAVGRGLAATLLRDDDQPTRWIGTSRQRVAGACAPLRRQRIARKPTSGPETIAVFDVLSSLRCPLHQAFPATTASLT